jgi:hypothetical protein
MSLQPEFAGQPEERQNDDFAWSGREDSNLRPLPPEDKFPRLIGLFLLSFLNSSLPFFSFLYQGENGPRFMTNLGPLSTGRGRQFQIGATSGRLLGRLPTGRFRKRYSAKLTFVQKVCRVRKNPDAAAQPALVAPNCRSRLQPLVHLDARPCLDQGARSIGLPRRRPKA